MSTEDSLEFTDDDEEEDDSTLELSEEVTEESESEEESEEESGELESEDESAELEDSDEESEEESEEESLEDSDAEFDTDEESEELESDEETDSEEEDSGETSDEEFESSEEEDSDEDDSGEPSSEPLSDDPEWAEQMAAMNAGSGASAKTKKQKGPAMTVGKFKGRKKKSKVPLWVLQEKKAWLEARENEIRKKREWSRLTSRDRFGSPLKVNCSYVLPCSAFASVDVAILRMACCQLIFAQAPAWIAPSCLGGMVRAKECTIALEAAIRRAKRVKPVRAVSRSLGLVTVRL